MRIREGKRELQNKRMREKIKENKGVRAIL